MKKIKTTKLDKMFDEGKDISKYLDASTNIRPNQKIRRVNIDFPEWVIEGLDNEAGRLGVTRQSLVKMWIAERLDRGTGK